MRLRYLFAASLLTMMTGRLLRISPPMEGSKSTHQTSPLFMGAVPEGCLGPFQRLFLPGLVLRHSGVFRFQVRSHDMWTHQLFDKFADLTGPDHMMKTLINFLVDGDGQLLLHETTSQTVIRIIYVYVSGLSTFEK